MATITVTVASTVKFDAPAGTVFSNWRFTLTPQTGTPLTQDVTSIVTPTVFTLVPDGVWVASAQRLDQNSNPLGPVAVGQPVTVTNTVTGDVPQTISVVVS